jgi:hypothetical protein
MVNVLLSRSLKWRADRAETKTMMLRCAPRRVPAGLIALLAALAVVPATAAASPTPFSPSSPWNLPLAPDAPLSPMSSTYVAELQRQVNSYGPWVNTSSFSTPVYRVGAHQRRVHVTLDNDSPQLAGRFAAVPVPAGAAPAVGSDGHMVVWQPSTDTAWEFWQMRAEPDGWHARWGGEMAHLSHNSGYFQAPFGATGTGLPLLGGLMRISELQAGHIDHALALAIPKAKRGSFVWPAQRSDGVLASRSAIPEGTRFRLDPDLDVDALRIPPITKIIAKAVQRYGMIVRDQAGAVALYAEDPTPTHTSLKYTVFGGLDGRQAMHAFPWRALQVVSPPAARKR